MRNLHKAFSRESKEIKKRANLIKIQLARTIALNLIIEDTPVDTSKALSNWVAAISNPKTKVRPAFFVGMDGSTHSQSSTMAYSMANAVIQRAKVGQVIYISNNVDYIELLNQGYSRQAPPDFIEKSVEKSINQVKGMKV